jgi:hypothetical protein
MGALAIVSLMLAVSRRKAIKKLEIAEREYQNAVREKNTFMSESSKRLKEIEILKASNIKLSTDLETTAKVSIERANEIDKFKKSVNDFENRLKTSEGKLHECRKTLEGFKSFKSSPSPKKKAAGKAENKNEKK